MTEPTKVVPDEKYAADAEALRESNTAALQRLMVDGVGLDPLQLLKERLDLITDVLIAADVVAEGFLEYEWEAKMAELLEAAESQVNQIKLTQGIQGLEVVR